jgi:O-antigen/teichoic acid export membrane protein
LFKSFAWDFFSRSSNQIIAFVVSIFLARLLAPEQFGVIGIALVFVSISYVFVDLGFGRAIIQSKEITQVQLSTIFYINVVISLVFAIICFFIAKPLAQFYHQADIEGVLKAISITFILNGLNIVGSSLLYRDLKFKQASIIAILSALLSGILGIIAAYYNYGVWALVIQNLSVASFSLIFTSLFVKWVPSFNFNKDKVNPLWKYSSKLFGSAVLETIFTRLDVFMIGKLFGTKALGFYTRAQSLDQVVKQISTSSLIAVLFPYLSRIQDNVGEIRKLYLKYLHLISFLSILASGILFLSANEIFIVLFTAKWTESAKIFSIFCIAGFTYPVSALMVSILTSRGNSRDYFRLEVLKKAFLVPVYVAGLYVSFYAFISLLVGYLFFAVFLNIKFVRREINIKEMEQFKIIVKYFAFAVIAVVGSWLVADLFSASKLLRIVINSLSFCSIYLILNIIFFTRALFYVYNKLQQFFFMYRKEISGS